METSPESPVPVRVVSKAIGDWVSRLGRIWVEGQVTQLTQRPGTSVCFMTLRDPVADVSLSVTCSARLLQAIDPPVSDGARVVIHAKPELYLARGSLSLVAEEIRPIGLGQLLARIEQLKKMLAAEGVFAQDRKRPLPFLPHVVGLICGRGSAAERDVLDNARRRWPAVQFRVEPVAVQGPYAVAEVIDALARLDKDADVDVIVITRGGGSVEDLLPFSDEALIRAVAACRTPVVSAIGHEQDSPILDLVADVRASTPTDAARRVVPDVAEEIARVRDARERIRRLVEGRVRSEQERLDTLRSRPVLGDPYGMVVVRSREVEASVDRIRRVLGHRLDRAYDDLAHTRARVAALSPAATLERGYAVVQTNDGAVVRSPEDVSIGERLRVRLAHNEIAAEVLPASADA